MAFYLVTSCDGSVLPFIPNQSFRNVIFQVVLT